MRRGREHQLLPRPGLVEWPDSQREKILRYLVHPSGIYIWVLVHVQDRFIDVAREDLNRLGPESPGGLLVIPLTYAFRPTMCLY
jgi:hypothetical protein